MGFANQELVRLVRVFFAFGDRQDKKFSDIGQDYGEEGVLKFLRLFDEKHCKYYLARVS